MSGLDNVVAQAPLAQASPQPTPTATPDRAPDTGTPNPQPTRAGANAVTPQQVAADKKEMETKANDVLTSASQQLGLGKPKLDTHYDRVSAAIKIYNTLDVKSPQDAAKFLEVMSNIGAKFAVNFGLSKPAADGKGQGVPLNADKFKGLDALYQQEQKSMVTTYDQQKAEAKANSGQPAPGETGNSNAGTEGQSVNDPEAVDAMLTQIAGLDPSGSADQLSLKEVAAHRDFVNDPSKGGYSEPEKQFLNQVLQKAEEAIKATGKPEASLADVKKQVLGTASGDTASTTPQQPLDESAPSAQPTPQPTTPAAQSNAAPDLRNLNVENLVRLASGGQQSITAATLAKALEVKGVPPDAVKVLKLMQAQLGNGPDGALPAADVLKSLQQIQQQQRGPGAPLPRAEATQVS
jgi:hypothetical protein